MGVRIGRKTASLSDSLTLAIDARYKAMLQAGEDAVSFGTGEPDFPTPAPICEAGLKAIRDGFTKYTPSGRSVQEGGVTPDILVPQLSDPDHRSRNRIRESDLRRHLVNEAGVRDELIQEDGRPDPRFAATAAELEQRGIEDFQLHYALQTLTRLSRVQTAGTPRRSSR